MSKGENNKEQSKDNAALEEGKAPETAGEVKDKPAAKPAEASGVVAEGKPKGNPKQPKSTARPTPSECAGCAKPLKKRIWYYRNGAFFCTKKCYKRKVEEDRKKKEEKK